MSNKENQLNIELLSYAGLNPFDPNVSAARKAMFTGNMGQFLAVSGATRRRIQSGMEHQFAKTTFSVKFKCDAEIIKVIHRYPRTVGPDAIRHNPQTIVIYEDVKDRRKKVYMLDIPEFHCSHQHFGFEYRRTDVFDQLMAGKRNFAQGSVVVDSPLVTPDGDYMYGLETNVAFMSDPAVIEDGIKISDAYLKRIVPRGYETRTIMFGVQDYPINLYGNEQVYKPFPDIGERIHSHGLLFALREYDEVLGVVNMTSGGLCKPDYIFDRRIYGEPNARIVDIKVECNTGLTIPPTPVGMEDQLFKYYDADTQFYKSILDVYYDLRYQRGDELRLDPDFHRLVVEAINRVGGDYHPKAKVTWKEKPDSSKVNNVYRGATIPHWRVDITYEYQSVPNIGFKLTDTDGGKGVVCSVVPEADMPIDENGNRVDIIMDDLSTTRRLNPARFFEQYLNAAGRDVVKRIREQLGFNPEYMSKADVRGFFTDARRREAIHEAYDYVKGFYELVSPAMVKAMESPSYMQGNFKEEHIASICMDGIYLFFPPDNPVHRPTMIREVQAKYPPFMTPVTFRNMDGEMVTTVKPVLIGSMYFMVLEKTAEDWSAVSSAKLNHYGNTARLTNYDKHSSPGRQNVTKTIGESESRLLAAALGGDVTADIMDATNNPLAHKYIQRTILTADKPTDIEEVLDRNEIPVGGHRPLSYIRHLFECSGKTFTDE